MVMANWVTGPIQTVPTPVQVYGMSGVTAIAAGDFHTVSLEVRRDGLGVGV